MGFCGQTSNSALFLPSRRVELLSFTMGLLPLCPLSPLLCHPVLAGILPPAGAKAGRGGAFWGPEQAGASQASHTLYPEDGDLRLW